ncbi:hypothetical protein [Rhizobium sp. PL01]|uniref:hypothetical protein n=1 Tax=Rhizobium sp. PL01 TaxID=3085631 RepID=UPI0029820DA5|nr:hypothetical protein [Rhizobium sp. PL01]MDW5317466.1 hypothetical protein [Rhizobium sp. PL01]
MMNAASVIDETYSVYKPHDLEKQYGLSPQEAIRIISQFGADKNEIDLLLGHKTTEDSPSVEQDNPPVQDFLFDI